MHVSQLMHSDISIRRTGSCHFGFRSRDVMRSSRVDAGIVDRLCLSRDHRCGPGNDDGGKAVAKYPFLSDEWLAEVRKLGEEHQGGGGVAHAVKMNQIITDVPFGDGTINAHMDTSSGEMQMDMGHVDNPDVTVTLDYETAKAIFVEGNPQAGMQAFMAGKVKVQGDMTKLMAMQTATPNPDAQAFAEKVKEMTE